MGFPEPLTFTVDDLAARWGKSREYVVDMISRGELTGRLRDCTVFHPKVIVKFKWFTSLDEVQKFEDRWQIARTPFSQRAPYQSELLHLANECAQAIYGNGAVRAKTGHRAMIERWIRKVWPDISDGNVAAFVTMVNQNKKGGHPTLKK